MEVPLAWTSDKGIWKFWQDSLSALKFGLSDANIYEQLSEEEKEKNYVCIAFAIFQHFSFGPPLK